MRLGVHPGESVDRSRCANTCYGDWHRKKERRKEGRKEGEGEREKKTARLRGYVKRLRSSSALLICMGGFARRRQEEGEGGWAQLLDAVRVRAPA